MLKVRRLWVSNGWRRATNSQAIPPAYTEYIGLQLLADPGGVAMKYTAPPATAEPWMVEDARTRRPVTRRDARIRAVPATGGITTIGDIAVVLLGNGVRSWSPWGRLSLISGGPGAS